MQPWERELRVSRAVCGRRRVRAGGRVFTAVAPGREARMLADEAFAETMRDAELQGIMDEEDSRRLLRGRGVLDGGEAALLAEWDEGIEGLKVALWEGWNDSDARDGVRRALAKARDRREEVRSRLQSLYHATREAVASAARLRFLTGASLLRADGSPYWPDPAEDWGRPDEVIDAAVEELARDRLTEGGVRELARTDPWRSIWASSKDAGRGVFDACGADLTDDQRALIMWGRHYDAIREHPSCPPESAIEDDDALDGWLAVQRKKRDAEAARTRLDSVKSSKIRGAQEVYFMAKTGDDIAEIARLNDGAAKAVKEQRMGHLKKHGRVNELQMPDTWMRFQMEAQQKFNAQVKA